MAAGAHGVDRFLSPAREASLDTVGPGQRGQPTSTTYDPGNPTPYLVDARELELNINEDYQAVHAQRNDLLTYTTAPLQKDTEITGPMTATLWAATDARDTDWNVMILDVYPDGRAMRIQDGVARARFRDGFDRPSLLTPGEVYRYDIDLWFTALVIPAGHRIRVTVASAAFPEVRPEPEHGRRQRAGHEVRGGAATRFFTTRHIRHACGCR